MPFACKKNNKNSGSHTFPTERRKWEGDEGGKMVRGGGGRGKEGEDGLSVTYAL